MTFNHLRFTNIFLLGAILALTLTGVYGLFWTMPGWSYDLHRLILLATQVGGEPLAHLHGAPLRAVVPTRRGWFWVKWLSHIEVI